MNKVINFLKNKADKAFMLAGSIATSAGMLMSTGFASFAGGVEDQTAKIKGGTIDLIQAVGGVLGLIWILWGIFSLIMAIRNEDSEGRNKAILNIVAGGVLTAFDVIWAFFDFG